LWSTKVHVPIDQALEEKLKKSRKTTGQFVRIEALREEGGEAIVFIGRAREGWRPRCHKQDGAIRLVLVLSPFYDLGLSSAG